MAEKLFGTDGVRGVANTELTPALALALGAAAARVFGRGHTPTFVIGRDTRISGTLLEAALSAGLCSMGAHVVSPGVLPTPAVASIARAEARENSMRAWSSRRRITRLPTTASSFSDPTAISSTTPWKPRSKPSFPR